MPGNQPDENSLPEAPRDGEGASRGQYVVIARRYRPQTFDELVGQPHVGQVLRRAIETNRVGHAYLFTGARGVGKTSGARIFAKALNCVDGPTAAPCNECDICRSVSLGDDVDVLEIDGASNRGIDEIRQLRQNVGVRPSRARFKIYIIDEVHMLTREAFNALLKTLEEPPEHVKFIFCTTEPHKIPVTILSRCQRFDFSGMQAATITARLEQILAAEGIRTEPEAMATISRRAGGSMRDAQSLLEQLLAFCGDAVTAENVQQVLGTASEQRIGELLTQLTNNDAAGALGALDKAIAEGVDLSPLVDQMLGCFRDVMITAAGCPADQWLYIAASQRPWVTEAAGRLGVETATAILQILDHAKSRMRYSSQGRTVLELALVRITQLERLDSLATLVEGLRDQSDAPADRRSSRAPMRSKPPASAGKKNETKRDEPDPGLAPRRPDNHSRPVELTPESVPVLWKEVLSKVSDLIAENASFYDSVAIRAPNRLVVSFRSKYTSCKAFCERPERRAKIEQALADVTGQAVGLEFALLDDAADSQKAPETKPRRSSRQQLAEVAQRPMLKKAAELFEARPLWIDSQD